MCYQKNIFEIIFWGHVYLFAHTFICWSIQSINRSDKTLLKCFQCLPTSGCEVGVFWLRHEQLGRNYDIESLRCWLATADFFYLFLFLPFLNKHLGKHHVWSGTVDESVTKPSKWAEAASIQMMHRLCSWGEPEELQKLIIPSRQRCQSSFARKCICGHGLCRRASRRPPRSLFLCNVWLWVKKGHFLQPDVVVYLLDHTFRDLAFKLFPGTNCIPVKFNFINLFIFFPFASSQHC